MIQDRLIELVGREQDVDAVTRELYSFAFSLRAPVVGAVHVTCADEAERECIDAFQNHFSERLLPCIKFRERSHFRIANLGGRYEWGAIPIADDHFSANVPEGQFKLMLVKINAHVSVERTGESLRFGRMQRYNTDSIFCGAIHALLEGSEAPFAKDLREGLTADGKDRLAVLRDDARVPTHVRSLFAAAISARLQARRAVTDLRNNEPKTPSLYVILPCVTLNRQAKDTEIVCGVYWADRRSDVPQLAYRGLGDDPSAYRLTTRLGTLSLEDDRSDRERSGTGTDFADQEL